MTPVRLFKSVDHGQTGSEMDTDAQVITEGLKTAFNLGIDAALLEVEKYNTGKDLSPLVQTLIANIKKLKK